MKLYAILLLASVIALSSGGPTPGPPPIPRIPDPNWDEIYATCYKLLRTSPEARKAHDADIMGENPESTCITRCIGILSGVYDDETGINMDMMEAGQADKEDFLRMKDTYDDCFGKIKRVQYGNDYCRKNFLVNQCLLIR